jgi:hypothetical protein
MAEYDGSYITTEWLESNHPVFRNEGFCFWWYRPSRHWYLGRCEDVGAGSGFIYLSEDNTCPSDYPSTWKKVGSDEVVTDFQVLIEYLQVSILRKCLPSLPLIGN